MPEGPPHQQAQAPAPAPAGPARNWHRFHYPIGIFLIAYGVTSMLGSLLGWDAHRQEIEDYLGSGAATPVLIAVKVVEALLILVTLAGVLRRRDVWFLPALLGWMGGFAVFCVFDLVKGKTGSLLEHASYVVLFLVLLGLTYAFGVKARVGGPAPVRTGPRPQNLSRTQEIALAALNRWQRRP